MWLTFIYFCFLLTICRPSGKFSPFPFQIPSLDEGWFSDPGCKWDAWASDHLASLGSHVHGKFSLLQVLFSVGLLIYLAAMEFTLLYELSFFVQFFICHLPYDISASSCSKLK
jgi:hypothetical protein